MSEPTEIYGPVDGAAAQTPQAPRRRVWHTPKLMTEKAAGAGSHAGSGQDAHPVTQSFSS